MHAGINLDILSPIKELKYIWFFTEIEKYFICPETNHPK